MDNSVTYKKAVNAWAMYDWANSAYITIVVAAIYPPFFRSVLIEAGFGEGDATAFWAYTASLALFLVSLVGPLLGAITDHGGGKKKFLAVSAGIGIIATSGLIFSDSISYLVVSGIFIVSNIGYSLSILFYESLLPHTAKPKDLDSVSARGYTLGYLGGGLLLLFNVLLLINPHWFGLSGIVQATKACLLSVSIWWALFTIPLLRRVPEPPVPLLGGPGTIAEGIRAGIRRLTCTFKEASRYRQLLIFLPAFWLYYEAIGTIIKMATAYGDEIGIDRIDMVIALLLTQFIGVPCTIGFSRIAGKFSAKTGVLAGLSVYMFTIVGAFFMTSSLHFYILAVLIGLAQGGTQALSRSLFAAMVPKTRSAEFFGLFSTCEKAAGILGPLLFGITSQLTGESRYGIIVLAGFLLMGIILLALVDVEKGKEEAGEKDWETISDIV